MGKQSGKAYLSGGVPGCLSNAPEPEEMELARFAQFLHEEERAAQTIRKYVRELGNFFGFLDGRMLDKEAVIAYRDALIERFQPQTVNGKLCAVNAYLRFCGRNESCVRLLRVQHSSFVEEKKLLHNTEYQSLIAEAEREHNERLSLLIQTIGETGVRVSELRYITVEAAQRQEAHIELKGKHRILILTETLCVKLQAYARNRNIKEGSIFVSKNGQPLNRSNIWRDMKRLCRRAEVEPDKVFPHSLRHLFARRFYAANQNLAYLADILGHTSVNTTRIYTAKTTKDHRRMLERMQFLQSEK